MNSSLDKPYYAISECLCCRSTSLSYVLDYGHAPLTDNYKQSLQDSLGMPRFPLFALMCRDCTHLQLGAQVNPSLSYQDYVYESSITRGLPKQFADYAEYLLSKHHSSNQKKLLDIGSNDGTFIESCNRIGFDSYGIEPASRLAEAATRDGIPTACGFFNNNIHDLLKESEFPLGYDIITFNNVLANINDPLGALKLAKKLLLNEQSLISIQTGYHPHQFKKGLFDWIYHEHFSYFSLKSLSTLAANAGLYISDYIFSDLRGGSMRVLLSTKEATFPDIYEYFTQDDHFIGLRSFTAESSKQLFNRLISLKHQGFDIYGYGASHSTGILVHNFGIQNLLTALIDDNPRKHNLFMPGTSLKVSPSETLSNLSPQSSAVVVLAWQYFNPIASRIRNLGYMGDIINPVLL